MADVFISHKREERAAVEVIAKRLRGLQLTVWVDAKSSHGRAFVDEIDREAREARAILVCWSPAARESNWVSADALIGFEQGKLVSCRIAGPNDLRAPTPFNSVGIEDLRSWIVAPNEQHPAWLNLLRRIGRLCGRADLERLAQGGDSSLGHYSAARPLASKPSTLAASAVSKPSALAASTLTNPSARSPVHTEQRSASKIFVSYRRSDSEAIAGRIYDRLIGTFKKEDVFFDVDTLDYGIDFDSHIRSFLAQSRVVIAVIGDNWIGAEGAATRIQDSADWVRREIELALQLRIRIVPVLVGSAQMPALGQLPPSIAAIRTLNAAPLSPGRDFHMHMDRLIRAVQA